MVEHFKQMGGVPLLAVFDRPKTVALAWRKDGVVTEWNPTFAAVTTELGIGVELCWPHAPQQKGSVENLVGWVKGSFFKQRRFWDRHDLETQLAEWLREVNEERPSRATGIIPEIRRQEELKRVRTAEDRSE
jgi:transposase